MTVEESVKANESKFTSGFFKKAIGAVEGRLLANRIICALMVASIVICCMSASFTTISASAGLVTTMTDSIYEYGVFTLVNIVLIELATISMLTIVFFDRRKQVMHARYAARISLTLIIAAMLSCLAVNGMLFVEYFYVFQLSCVIAYQIFNDPNISFNAPWYNPFSKREREAAKEDVVFKRDKYMPLNFFNIFWIFMICCVVGILIETWYRLMTVGILEDRAGLLWGPFSPIYGVGGTLMTIALNRFWNKSPIVIFLVSALIGGGFEFFTSWYMEIAFGISAWDYSDMFMNLDGRTDLAHSVAWGVLGFMWIRFCLPVMMRLVDAIKMKWRAVVTVLAFTAMMVNVVMTIMALDAWSMRVEGIDPQNEVQEFYAEHFGDEWMENRFQTMTVSRTGSVHSHLLAEADRRAEAAEDNRVEETIKSEDGISSDDTVPDGME